MRHHDQIQRDVADIEGGVETLTTTDDPELVAQIRKHVRQMESRMRAGHGMRHWDPLFAELFRQHDKIRIEISDIDGGVRVRETSDEPRVAELIRRHARAVSEFVHDGPPRMHRPTSLPEGYAPGH